MESLSLLCLALLTAVLAPLPQPLSYLQSVALSTTVIVVVGVFILAIAHNRVTKGLSKRKSITDMASLASRSADNDSAPSTFASPTSAQLTTLPARVDVRPSSPQIARADSAGLALSADFNEPVILHAAAAPLPGVQEPLTPPAVAADQLQQKLVE